MQPILGQIQAFGFNFAPRGWATCDGQLLPIASNTALFSLLGTIYGGDGRTTFALPDLRGRTMLHQGTGPGQTPRQIGQKSGAESTTLTAANLPAHGHPVAIPVNTGNASTEEPGGNVLATSGANLYAAAASPGASYQAFNTGNAGNSASFNNMQPYLAVNICIALQGIFPQRS